MAMYASAASWALRQQAGCCCSPECSFFFRVLVHQVSTSLSRSRVASRLEKYHKQPGIGASPLKKPPGPDPTGRGGIEISFCGGFDAIGNVAVINFVQIQFQNLVFGVSPFDFGSKDDLAGFANDGLVIFSVGESSNARANCWVIVDAPDMISPCV